MSGQWEQDPVLVELLAVCREEFPPEAIGYKPTVWCKACRTGECGEHHKSRCDKCKQNISTAHMDIAFIGHAVITDRLSTIDAGWSMKPAAEDEHGQPVMIEQAVRIQRQKGFVDATELSLWVDLTLRGFIRRGCGTVIAGKPEALKELWGDCLRNAAMRFGVGLYLWAGKTDLPSGSGDDDEDAASASGSAPAGDPGPGDMNTAPADSDRQDRSTAGSDNGVELGLRDQLLALMARDGVPTMKARRAVLEQQSWWPIQNIDEESLPSALKAIRDIKVD